MLCVCLFDCFLAMFKMMCESVLCGLLLFVFVGMCCGCLPCCLTKCVCVRVLLRDCVSCVCVVFVVLLVYVLMCYCSLCIVRWLLSDVC